MKLQKISQCEFCFTSVTQPTQFYEGYNYGYQSHIILCKACFVSYCSLSVVWEVGALDV